VTALLSLVGLIGIRARRSRPGVEPSAHPGGPFGRAPTV
jgi:hypothetical protein